MFYKKAVLKKFYNIHRKTTALECFLIKFQASTWLKRDSTQLFSSEYYEIFKNTYFEKHLQTTASVNKKSQYKNYVTKVLRYGDHSFSTPVKFPEKLTFLILWYA